MKKSQWLFLGFAAASVATATIGGLIFNQAPGILQAGGDTRQPDPADFYRDKNIRFLIPADPGGGFDAYVRMIAPYFERYTGATVRAVNLPGAGGMRVANELNHSPRDGLTIAILNGSALVSSQLAGMKGADYDVETFAYIGRVSADSRVLVMNAGGRYQTVEDVWTSPETIKLGATGLGGSDYVDAVIVKEAFDLNMQIIHGFDGSARTRQAMLRGNLDGSWGSWGSAENAVGSGQEKILLQSGTSRIADLPDVPAVFEYIGKAADPARARAILNAWNGLISVGRPVAAPPGTPAPRVRFLQEALRQTLHDPELIDQSEKVNRPVDYASGEAVLAITKEAMHMPEDIKPIFIRAIRGEL